MKTTILALGLVGALFCARAAGAQNSVPLLPPESFLPYVERFNSMEPENVVNSIPNARAWEWMSANVPRFECADKGVEETYYFRWWSFRKHIKQTPQGFVVTEFLVPVSHAGAYNTISCALGLHLSEGRWLRDGRIMDDYTRFWFRGNAGKVQPHFHKFSSWAQDAIYNRFKVSGDGAMMDDLLPDMVADYRLWEGERLTPGGLFWQYDVRDGMEESISGARHQQNLRPTINSYMFANARAIAAIARGLNPPDLALAHEFEEKAARLKQLVQQQLWDGPSHFFKVRTEKGELSNAREAVGFIPWMFNLPDAESGYESAWAQLRDENGFNAPAGITTAERRHPQFRTHGIGTCEWDGAVWPFATSQTLVALGNVLRNYPQNVVSRRDYFDQFLAYARSQTKDGKPYIGEYLDEKTGEWIKVKDGERSRYYNHSLFADLVISGVVGLVPRADSTLEINPLLPPGQWSYFCLDGVLYHGRSLTILWDENGGRYGRGQGLRVYADGQLLAHAPRLQRITTSLFADASPQGHR